VRLLVAEDDDIVRFTLRDALEEQGYDVVECADGAAALRALQAGSFDLVLTDVRLPGVDGIALFRHARRAHPGAAVVLMTAHGDTNDAVAVMREGARDYVLKPFDMDELLLRVARVRDEVEFRRSMEAGDASPAASHPIVGASPAMKKVLDRIDAAAASDVPVLVSGEVGTGKDLCARAIHARSRRAANPFVVVECGAAPAEELEAALFGTAATASERRRAGQVENANGGTLYLDEVGELPAALQGRVAQLLAAGAFTPPGATRPTRVNVRFVASSTRDLRAEVERRRFRRDLLYALAVLDVQLPPLRDRRADVPLLARHFLGRMAAREGRADLPALEPAASAALAAWDFPGNVRELVHVLERAVALARGGAIGLAHLPPELTGGAEHDRPAAGEDVQPLSTAVAQFEREYIQRALDKVGGHRTRAAALLGISRKSLWERLREEREKDRPDE
jgi:two-component system, NtrC family, response regulator AtoC